MKLSAAIFLSLFLIFSGVNAQSKKSSGDKKPAAKTAAAKKDTKKGSAKAVAASKNASKKDDRAGKSSKDARSAKAGARSSADAKARPSKDDARKGQNKNDRADRRSKQDSTRSARNESSRNDDRTRAGGKDARKDAARDSRRGSEARAAESRRAAEARRAAEEERQRIAEARRQAALEERRRREQAIREARERKIAFERGLRTQTAANILNDNTDGEDLAVRRAAIAGLGSRAGTVVVMEAQTGKLLTVVNQEWAIKQGFKPCSTIKLVTGVAGLNERLINEDGGIGGSANGMKLDYALAKSNNYYFQRVGTNLGNTKMISYARKLGLGEPTGVNAGNEYAGRLPYGNNNSRIYSHGDDFEVTPLQLAVLVSAVSNGGRKVVPRFDVPRIERTNYRARSASRLDIPRERVEGVLPGMAGAAEYGTARRGVDASMGVAGKTGSCIEKGSWVGLFASVAPVEDPKYAVVVITRGESERGKYAAAVAGRVYAVLRSRITRDKDSLWARKLKEKTHEGEVFAKSTGGSKAEEGVDESDQVGGKLAPIIVGRGAAPAAAQVPAMPEKRLVQKTTISRPVFAPIVIEYDRNGAPPPKQRPRIVKN